MQTGARKAGGVEHARVPHSKSRIRSLHVEVVPARSFAKQRGYMNNDLFDTSIWPSHLIDFYC